MNNTTSIRIRTGVAVGTGHAQASSVRLKPDRWHATGQGFLCGARRAVKRGISRCGLFLAGITGLLVAGCAELNSGPPAPALPLNPAAAASAPVILGEGDVVKLLFPGAVEFNTSQKIRTDGKLSLPLIGEAQAAGKTLPRLQSELSARYKTQLQNSEVVVSLETSGAPIIISGAVATPGKVLLDRPTTLLEAIMGAGGFTPFAKKRKVRLIRVVNGQYHTEVYDMSKGLTDGSTTPVVYVKGGDVIYVPQSNW